MSQQQQVPQKQQQQQHVETPVKQEEIISYQQEFYQIKARRLQSENSQLNQEITMLKKKLAEFESNNQSILQQQNEQLKEELYAANLKLQQKNNKASETIDYRSAEFIRSNHQDNVILARQINLLKEKYDIEIIYLQQQNKDLRNRLLQSKSYYESYETNDLQIKYKQLLIQDSQLIQTKNLEQIRLLLLQIQRLKQQLDQKYLELRFNIEEQNKLKMELELSMKEIKTLNLLIQTLHKQKSQAINGVQTTRLLQRSRNKAIVDISNESSVYFEHQIKKLTEELRQKNQQIQNLKKQQKSDAKRFEEAQRQFQSHIETLKEQSQIKIRQYTGSNIKRQSSLQQQFLLLKNKNKDLEIEITNLKLELQNQKRQQQMLNNLLTDQKNQNLGLKAVIEQERENHIKQLTKYTNDKLLKRASSKSISRISLTPGKQPQPQTDPQSEEFLQIVNELDMRDQNKENATQRSVIEQVQQNKRLDGVYEFKINELTKSHNIKLQKSNAEVQKLQKQLKQKTKELEDVLTRFSPLVQLKSSQTQLSQQRKQMIQKHLKAHISILQVLLKKHKIKVWES